VDAFLTAAENDLRRRAREYFRSIPGSSGLGENASWERILRDLDGREDRAAVRPAALLSETVAIIEGAASCDPGLARGLLPRCTGSRTADPVGDRLCAFARLTGAAAHVLEAGARTARERGVFASSLMGCREVQESLAGIAWGAELLRLGTCRVLRLLDRGEPDRAEAESARLLGRAAVLARETRSVALSLLGEAWVGARLAGIEPSPTEERTRS
jgi:hypothetical protein